MRYLSILQKQKAQLQFQLNIKKALIKKYDIEGYISHKRIGQRTYDYLQYRDEMVRLYLYICLKMIRRFTRKPWNREIA